MGLATLLRTCRCNNLCCRSSHTKIDALWSGQHHASKNALIIRQRKDHHLLCSIYEQGKQIAQTVVQNFGELPLPQPEYVSNDHPAVEKALKFLLPFRELN